MCTKHQYRVYIPYFLYYCILSTCQTHFPDEHVRSLLANNHGCVRRVRADVLGGDAPTEHRIFNSD